MLMTPAGPVLAPDAPRKTAIDCSPIKFQVCLEVRHGTYPNMTILASDRMGVSTLSILARFTDPRPHADVPLDNSLEFAKRLVVVLNSPRAAEFCHRLMLATHQIADFACYVHGVNIVWNSTSQELDGFEISDHDPTPAEVLCTHLGAIFELATQPGQQGTMYMANSLIEEFYLEASPVYQHRPN